MEVRLDNRLILVTGAASGIGRSTAIAAAASGARVVLSDSSGEGCEAVADQIRALGGEAHIAAFDVRDTDAACAEVERIEATVGPLFGLVAAAGTSAASTAEGMTESDWQTVIDVNLNGVFRTIQAAGRGMLRRREGAIVTLASVDAFGGRSGRANYVTTKFGIVGMTKSLAVEWGRFGVRTNAVAPGPVDTALLRKTIPERHLQEVMIDRIPLGRLSEPIEQAKVCIFLLSDAASYINGAILAVDGGATAGFFTARGGADYASHTLLDRGSDPFDRTVVDEI